MMISPKDNRRSQVVTQSEYQFLIDLSNGLKDKYNKQYQHTFKIRLLRKIETTEHAAKLLKKLTPKIRQLP